MSRGATAKVLYAVATTVVALVLLLISPDEVGAALALVGISTAMVLAAAVFPPGVDHRDFGDVLFLAGLPFLLGFGLRTLLSLAGFAPINMVGELVQDPFQFAFDEHSLHALMLATFAWAVLTCGYRLRVGKALAVKLPNPSLGDIHLDSIRAATIALAAVGWTARIASMTQGGVIDPSTGLESVNALSTLLLWLSYLTTTSSTLALFAVFFRPAGPVNILLATGLVAGELAAGFATGSRTLVFTPLVSAAAMAYLTGRYHLRLRHLLVIPAILLVIGITDTYRNPGLIVPTVVDADDTVARAQLAIDEAAAQGPFELSSRGAFNIAVRYHGLYSVAQILRVGQPSELSYGATYALAVPAALIPRFLWPGKPFPTYGVEFGRHYFGVPDNVGVSIAPTWIGDLMLNLPLLVAVSAMGLLGVLLRAFRDYGLRARRGTTFAVLIYPVLLPIIIQSDGWISGAMWQTTQAVAVMVVAFALMRSLGSPRNEQPSRDISAGAGVPTAGHEVPS